MLVPVSNRAYIRRTPIVTLAIIAVNAALFVIGATGPAPERAAHDHVRLVSMLRDKYASQDPPLVFELRFALGQFVSIDHPDFKEWRRSRVRVAAAQAGLGSYWNQTMGFVPADGPSVRMVTSLFLHGGWEHVLTNMIFLFVLGCNVEDRWGRVRYLLFYLLAGTAASLAHYGAFLGDDKPLVGASGAVSGVMGAFLVYFAFTKVRIFFWIVAIGTFEIRAVYLIVAFSALDVAGVLMGGSSIVAYFAHLGGFGVGLAIAGIERLVRGPGRRTLEIPTLESKRVSLFKAFSYEHAWERDAATQRAEKLLSAGQHDEAILMLVDVLESDASHESARWALVRAYHAAGKRREARELGHELVRTLRSKGRDAEAEVVLTHLLGGPGMAAKRREG
jgi:membrane associated rhomboid family serine protease